MTEVTPTPKKRSEIHLLLSGRWFGFVNEQCQANCKDEHNVDAFAGPDPVLLAQEIRAAHPGCAIAPICTNCRKRAAEAGKPVGEIC